jgi:hypothetical protein
MVLLRTCRVAPLPSEVPARRRAARGRSLRDRRDRGLARGRRAKRVALCLAGRVFKSQLSGRRRCAHSTHEYCHSSCTMAGTLPRCGHSRRFAATQQASKVGNCESRRRRSGAGTGARPAERSSHQPPPSSAPGQTAFRATCDGNRGRRLQRDSRRDDTGNWRALKAHAAFGRYRPVQQGCPYESGGWHRLVTPATFIGGVVAGADYLLVDDHVGFGGTLANLRGHIEANGGHVLGMTTLTETGGGREIAIRRENLLVLQSKHGNELVQFWRVIFGHDIDCLTNLEAGYLSRVESLDAIRTRMAQAAKHARGRGVSAVDV